MDECKAARRRLEEAIAEVDRTRHGNRSPNEILTHWAVVYSHTMIETDDDGTPVDSTQVSTVRSDGMGFWEAHGLHSFAAKKAAEEPWEDDDDEPGSQT